MMANNRALKTSSLITDLFALDRDNAWFGQTVEGIEPPKKKKTKTHARDFNPYHEPAGSPKGGQFAHAPTSSFISPNVGNLSWQQAKEALESDEQKKFHEVSAEVDKELGINRTSRDVIGAWADGAENSTITISHGVDFETAQLAAAMKGYLADQKSVLVFKADAKGDKFMASFDADGDLDFVHEKLLQNGVMFHTLEDFGDGTVMVHVYGEDQETLDTIAKAADGFGADLDVIRGTGGFIGTTKEDGTDREQRDDARRIYQQIIENASQRTGRDVAELWARLRASRRRTSDQEALDREWREEDHPRHPAGSEKGGEFAPKGAVSNIVGIPDLSEDMSRGDDNRRQPVKSVEELIEKSKEAQAEYLRALDNLAARTGSVVKQPGLKSLERILEKTRNDYGGDFTKVKDVLRGSIVSDTVLKSRTAAALFIAEQGDKILRVKDRYVNPTVGYRDILLNYVTDNGMIVEMQFITDEMLSVKKIGHNYYERQRVLFPELDRMIASDGDVEQAVFMFNLLTEKQERIYTKAYNASGNGYGWQKRKRI